VFSLRTIILLLVIGASLALGIKLAQQATAMTNKQHVRLLNV